MNTQDWSDIAKIMLNQVNLEKEGEIITKYSNELDKLRNTNRTYTKECWDNPKLSMLKESYYDNITKVEKYFQKVIKKYEDKIVFLKKYHEIKFHDKPDFLLSDDLHQDERKRLNALIFGKNKGEDDD